MNSSNRKQVPWKKVLCNDFKNKGRCPRGKDCNFAHGTTELKAVENHEISKRKSSYPAFDSGEESNDSDEDYQQNVASYQQ